MKKLIENSQAHYKFKPLLSLFLKIADITKRNKTHDRSRKIQNIEIFKSLDVSNKEN